MKELFTLVVMLFLASSAHAQSLEAPQREGFTVLVNVGPSMQKYMGIDRTAFGFGSLNFGVGEFLKEDLALLLRVSTTNAMSQAQAPFNRRSGYVGTSLQYWVNDAFFIESGPGLGFTRDSERKDTWVGLGALIGAGATLYNKRKSNVQLGIEYAPAILVGNMIHNFRINLGYQLL